MEVMYVKKDLNSYTKNKKIIGIVGELSDLKVLVNDIEYIKLKSNYSVKKIMKNESELLEKFGLTKDILNKQIKDLSKAEFKIISLIKTIMLNPDVIILNNFEVGINDRDLNTIIRFLKNVISDNNINTVLLSKDIMFLKKAIKEAIIMKNGIIKFQGDLIVAAKQGHISKPSIVKFIELANKKKINLTFTLDEKELLKDIYRSVY